ncbi:hypothetical protein, variant [Capsaspora owczarzaki ATCC 30864]|nr:hypothetical protein, variant [Capsaspora owczarzaki ATCC 30864]|eukprot:XP_011269941.1 hypothetical protein, variant [Capsaspora owczarzaki ATCC 30864]
MTSRHFADASGTFTLGACGDTGSSTIAYFDTNAVARLPTIQVYKNDLSYFGFSFRTVSGDSLLAFQGSSRTDFLSFELVSGVFTTRANCGSGIGSVATGTSLNDGKWHSVQVWITGKNIAVQVDDTSVAYLTTPGALSMLNFDRPLILGVVIPADVAGLPGSLISLTFDGCIRDVYISGYSKAIDFVNDLYSGAPASLECVDNKVAHFGVNSYAQFTVPLYDDAVQTNTISFEFRTSAYNGFLLYQSGLQTDYVSIQILNGFVQAKFNPGSGAATLTSGVASVDDNQWHTVTLSWLQKSGSLTVDGQTVTGTSSGSTISVNTTSYTPLFVGGVPTPSIVTAGALDFYANPDLCIRELSVSPLAYTRDFVYDTGAAPNVALSCPGTPAAPEHTAWFGPKSFVRIPNIDPQNVGNAVQFVFRAASANGPLFYQPGISVDHVAVQLVHGAVKLTWNAGSGNGTLVQGFGLADGAAHTVQFGWIGKVAWLSVDGAGPISGSSLGALVAVNTTGDAIIGNFPAGFTVQAGIFDGSKFEGCVSAFKLVSDIYHRAVDFNTAVAKSVRGFVCGTAPAARFDATSYAKFATFTPIEAAANTISLKFSTTARDAVLLYQGGIATDFISIELANGHIVFKWNPGSGAGVLTSTQAALNDNTQHTVVATFNGQSGSLVVDSAAAVVGSSVGALVAVNTTGPLYIGGFDAAVPSAVVSHTYSGCISHISLDGTDGILDYVQSALSTRVVAFTCAASVFNFDNAGTSGQSRAVFDPLVPSDSSLNVLNVDFKTTAAGLILYQEGISTDFISLETTAAGNVVFKFNPGSGAAVITSSGNTYLDGQWHTLTATWFEKSGSLSVDGGAAVTGNSIGSTIAVNTTNHLALGQYTFGDPNGFNGCIGNVVFNGFLYTAASVYSSVNVALGCSAPTRRAVGFAQVVEAVTSSSNGFVGVFAIAGVAFVAVGVVVVVKRRQNRAVATDRV